MTPPRMLLARLFAPFRRRRLDAVLDEEVRAHLDRLGDDHRARGLSPQAAREAARRDFGSVARITEDHRDQRSWMWLDDARRDLAHACRGLGRAPLFSFFAVFTLALGIGANSAIFGVVKSVLLDALPYADADRLVRVYGRMLDGSQERGPLSAGTINDIAVRQGSFESLAAFVDLTSDATYGDSDGSRNTKIAWVERGFFETLGVAAMRGRTFQDDDATSGLVPLSGGQLGPDTARVVLLTHAAWQRLFVGDPGVLGREVRINGIPRTIVGVLPREFIGPMGQTDFYFAFDLGSVVANPVTARRAHWLGLVGRLKPGVTHEGAQRQLAVIGGDLAREYPKDNGGFGVAAMPLRDAMVGDRRTPLLVLMASAALRSGRGRAPSRAWCYARAPVGWPPVWPVVRSASCLSCGWCAACSMKCRHSIQSLSAWPL